MNITTAPTTVTPNFSPDFPTPALTRAATLLDDPLIFDWAMRYFEHPSRTQDEKQGLTTLWFTPNRMSAFFKEGDTKKLLRLLQALPPEHFLPWTTQVITCWQANALDLCLTAAKTLSLIDPILAEQTFKTCLDSGAQLRVEFFMSIAASLQYLPAASQVPLLENMLACPKPEKNQPGEKIWNKWASDIYRALFKVALQNQHGSLPELFQLVLTEMHDPTLSEDQELEFDTIRWLAMTLLGDYAWANSFLADFYGMSLFQNLADLLEEAAPVVEMIEIFQIESSHESATAALALLGSHHARLPATNTCWQLLKGCDIEQYPLTIRTLALAAVATAFERKTLDTHEATLTQLTTWLALDIETNHHYASLTQQIGHFPKTDIVTAICTQFEQTEKNSAGRMNLIRFIGELGWFEFIPLLLNTLARNEDNPWDENEDSNEDENEDWDEDWDEDEDENAWLYDAATLALINIPEAGSALIQAWDALDFNQQWLGTHVLLKHSNAAHTVSFLLTHLETMMDMGSDLWFELTLMNPDVHLLGRLKNLLPQHNLMVEHCFYCACRLLNITHPKLGTIREKVSARMQMEAFMNQLISRSNDLPADLPPSLLPWDDPIQVVSRAAPVTQVINENKTGRNDPCPCGSGKKYKKCCMQ